MAGTTMSFAGGLEVIRLLRDECLKRSNEDQLKFIRYCIENAMLARSQFFQDLWVAWELGSPRSGFFVEFGAANGRHASNTHYLEKELGWRGILSEPARHWYPHIQNYRNCYIDRRAVFSETGRKVIFVQPPIALHSTIAGYEGGDYAAATRMEGERYEVETVSLSDLLAHWNAPLRIDYISIDTEGSELDIIRPFDFARWDVRLFTIEHAGNAEKRAGILEVMTRNGYERKFANLSGDDDWYVRRY